MMPSCIVFRNLKKICSGAEVDGELKRAIQKVHFQTTKGAQAKLLNLFAITSGIIETVPAFKPDMGEISRGG